MVCILFALRRCTNIQMYVECVISKHRQPVGKPIYLRNVLENIFFIRICRFNRPLSLI